ncbi:MAG: permease-like cell division protein FtsX [Thiohalorhabdus sp.]
MSLRIRLHQHREAFDDALVQLGRAPGSTLLTTLVLALALALPAILLVTTDNLERLTDGFDAPGTLNVFLHPEEPPDREAMEERLRELDGIKAVAYTPPDQALEEAADLLGLGDALADMPDNPLPGSFRVTVAPDRRAPERMSALAEDIDGWSGVDQVQYERQWVERFQAVVDFLRSLGGGIALILGGVVILVIGNTIRLAVAARRREIEVVKMIGGTDAFVRRPFLYAGLVQGLLAAVGAGLLVAMALAFLDAAVADLAARYGARLGLEGPGAAFYGNLLLAGGALGWLGSRVAVRRHLREIEPA